MMHYYKKSKNILKGTALAVLFSFIAAFSVNSQVQVMVDDDGVAFTDIANHTTWATATNDLQAAIDAVAADPAGGEVWVAGGTYYPTTLRAADPLAPEPPLNDPTDSNSGADPRQASFVMASSVRVLGGFAGTETSEAGRPADLFGSTNRVILSGDLGTIGDNIDNAYHVVLFPKGVDNAAILEAVYVTEGNANSNDYFAYRGAGIHLREGGTIRGCVVSENHASGGGGGIYLYAGGNLTGGEVSANTTPGKGGGVFLNMGGEVSNCLIHSNQATDPVIAQGGGVFMDGTLTDFGTISHSSINGNISANKGAGIYVYLGGNIINNFISNNEATGNGGGIYSQDGGKIINNTIVSNFADHASGVYANEGGEMYNTVLWGNATQYSTNIQFDYEDLNGTYQVLVDHCAIQDNADPLFTNSINLNTANTGTGIENHPYFIDPITFAGIPANQAELDEIYNSNYRINIESALLDAGLTSPGATLLPPFDMAGNTRVLQNTVDIGAFEANYFDINSSVSSGNGTIDPLDANVLIDEDVLFTLTPEAGFEVANFSINGTDFTSNIVADGNSFTYNQTVTENIDATVTFGVANNLTENKAGKFRLYPVPAESELFISGASIQKIAIFSADGKLVKILEDTNIKSIPVSGLKKGLYLISLTRNSGEVLNTRFIKK
jgi:predicted outer membrane repeat protein